jgi:hypothetical protein
MIIRRLRRRFLDDAIVILGAQVEVDDMLFESTWTYVKGADDACLLRPKLSARMRRKAFVELRRAIREYQRGRELFRRVLRRAD